MLLRTLILGTSFAFCGLLVVLLYFLFGWLTSPQIHTVHIDNQTGHAISNISINGGTEYPVEIAPNEKYQTTIEVEYESGLVIRYGENGKQMETESLVFLETAMKCEVAVVLKPNGAADASLDCKLFGL